MFIILFCQIWLQTLVVPVELGDAHVNISTVYYSLPRWARWLSGSGGSGGSGGRGGSVVAHLTADREVSSSFIALARSELF